MFGPARVLVGAGLILIAAGLIIGLAGKLPSWIFFLGKLPGDLVLYKKKMVVYIPLASSVLLSLLLSLVLKLWFRK